MAYIIILIFIRDDNKTRSNKLILCLLCLMQIFNTLQNFTTNIEDSEVKI